MLESLVQTVGLTALGDPDLRGALTRWLLVKEGALDASGFMISEGVALGDYMKPRYPFRDIDHAEAVGTIRFSIDPTPILRDLEFENHISQQLYAAQVMMSHISLLDLAAVRVLDHLGAGEAR